MNIFDKDYNMLKALENGAKSRDELCNGTTTAASRLTRLLDLGYIISDSWEPVPGQETKFRLTGKGRAYIQDLRRNFNIFIIKVIIFDIIIPIVMSVITTLITIAIT